MGAFPIVATIYSSGLHLCSLPFVKQDSAGAFVGLERVPHLTPELWRNVAAGMLEGCATVKHFKSWYGQLLLQSSEYWGGWGENESAGLCEDSPSAGVTLERDCATKKRQRIIASVTINVDWGLRGGGNFSYKVGLHPLLCDFFFLSIQGQFTFSSEMTIIYQQGANSTVDRYQWLNHLATKKWEAESVLSLNMEGFWLKA